MDINTAIQGRAKAFVYRGDTNELVYESPYTKNLILNNGLNYALAGDISNEQGLSIAINNVAAKHWMVGLPVGNPSLNTRSYYAYGSGSTPNSFLSEISGVSATQSQYIVSITPNTNNVNLSAFNLLKQYDVLTYDNGSSVFVTSANNTYTEFVVNKSYTYSTPLKFRAWNTSRHTLDTNKTYQTSNNPGLNTDVITITEQSCIAGVMSASFFTDFSINNGATQYVTEVGACTGSANTTAMATRVTFDPPIEVINGDKLVVKYDYIIQMPLLSASTLGYSYTSGVSANVAGWPNCTGSFTLISICTGSNNDNILGTTNGQNYFGAAVFVTSQNNQRKLQFVSTSSEKNFNTLTTPFTSNFIAARSYANGYNDTSNITRSISSIPNTFEKTFNVIFQTNSFSSSNIGGIIFNGYENSASNRNPANFYCLNPVGFFFDTPQSKSAAQRLTFTITTKMSRDLPYTIP